MSAPIEVRSLDGATEAAYAAFLETMPDQLLYYSLPYRGFLEDILGCRSDYQLAIEDGRITGVLPLMVLDGPWGKVVNSLPFYGSHGGALAATHGARDALHARFDAVSAARDVAAAVLITHPLRQPSLPPVAHDFTDERIGQWTQLPADGPQAEEHLLDMFDGSARRNVRKARHAGVTVRVDCAAWDFLERIHRENMARIGGHAKAHVFFDGVDRHFRADDQYRIYVAEREGRMLAALLLFYCGQTVEYFTPVVVEDERSHQPMAPIIVEAMMDALRMGFRWWNWGGTWKTQDGVHRFKSKWGARDFTYRYFIKLNRRDILRATPQDLVQAYPDFYVVPYSELESESCWDPSAARL